MARGIINNFFRRLLPGKALRYLADVDNINKLANILNDIKGEGCVIEKPIDSDGYNWKIIYDGVNSDLPVKHWPYTTDTSYNVINTLQYDSANSFTPWKAHNLDFSVNGEPVLIPEYQDMTWQGTLNNDGEVLELYIGVKENNGVKKWYFHTMSGYFSHHLTVKYAKIYPNGRFEPLIEGQVNLYFVSGDKSIYTDWSRELRGDADNLTIETTAAHTPYQVNNFDTTQYWSNEWPDGHYTVNPETQEIEIVEPDENAIYRNEAYKALLRFYDNDSVDSDKHGHRKWIKLRDLAGAVKPYIEDKIDGDATDHTGLYRNIQTLLEELLEKVFYQPVPACPYQYGSYNPDTDSWNDEGLDSNTKCYVLENEIIPYRIIWEYADPDRDEDGNWRNLSYLIGALFTDLSGLIATWDSNIEDEDQADDNLDSAKIDLDSVSSWNSLLNIRMGTATAQLGTLLNKAGDLEARMAEIEE